MSLMSGTPISARKIAECCLPRQGRVESIGQLPRHGHRTTALRRTHVSAVQVPRWPSLDQAPPCRRAGGFQRQDFAHTRAAS